MILSMPANPGMITENTPYISSRIMNKMILLNPNFFTTGFCLIPSNDFSLLSVRSGTISLCLLHLRSMDRDISSSLSNARGSVRTNSSCTAFVQS